MKLKILTIVLSTVFLISGITVAYATSEVFPELGFVADDINVVKNPDFGIKHEITLNDKMIGSSNLESTKIP